MRLLPLVLAFALAACDGTPAPPTDAATSDGPCPGTAAMVPNEGWIHIDPTRTPMYQHNPPASGPHYPNWAAYRAYTTTVPRGNWVHNLEHGGVVLLHRPDAPLPLIQALRDAYDAIPDDPACGHKRAILTPDPALDVPIAAVAADWVLPATCADRAALLAFVQAHRGQGPEDVCAEGIAP